MDGPEELNSARVTDISSYVALINAMMELAAFPEVIKTCIEASTFHPAYSGHFDKVRAAALSYFNNTAGVVAQSHPFHEQKRILSFGTYYVRSYPWLPIQYRSRSEFSIQVANKNLKKVSNCLEIRPSFIGGNGSTQGEISCYGVFATKRIAKGQSIISETHPFAVSMEQPKVHCASCFTDLDSCAVVYTLKCCSTYKYCSSKCENVARCYHSAVCGKDFSEVVDLSHKSYGGKWEGAGFPKGKTALSHYTGWPDKILSMTDNYRFAFPDHTPVFLIRFLAMIIQSGCDPLDHPVISPLMPHDGLKIMWSLNGMVVGPIKALQLFGIDVFADQRFDTWVILTMW